MYTSSIYKRLDQGLVYVTFQFLGSYILFSSEKVDIFEKLLDFHRRKFQFLEKNYTTHIVKTKK